MSAKSSVPYPFSTNMPFVIEPMYNIYWFGKCRSNKKKIHGGRFVYWNGAHHMFVQSFLVFIMCFVCQN